MAANGGVQMSPVWLASHKLKKHRPSTRIVDKYSAVYLSACIFALIVFPLLTFIDGPSRPMMQIESRPESRIFWPAVAVISVLFAVEHRRRLRKLLWPPHLLCLLAYLTFAGASVIWAFSPESSSIRFAQQAMIVMSIVMPAMLASQTVDMMRGLFLCFALSVTLNLLFVLNGSVTIAQYGATAVDIGYQGYFLGKNYLGECAAAAILLAFHEMLYPRWRKVLGVIVLGISLALLFLSGSKTALGLAFIAPFVAGATLVVRKITRLSPAVILLTIPLSYIFVSNVSHFSMNRVSYMLYGDSTFTGRTIIWDFAQQEIDRSPLVGWGYQSFWLVGPDAPSVVDAPGWVKMMPNAHNGYYDTLLELGYVGLSLLLLFVIATLHGIGRVALRDPRRAWLLLSLVLFVVMYNFLESLWMRGFEFLWVVFVFAATEIARYGQPLMPRRAVASPRRPGSVGAVAFATPQTQRFGGRP